MKKTAKITATSDGVTVETKVDAREWGADMVIVMLVAILDNAMECLDERERVALAKTVVLKNIREVLDTVSREYREKLSGAMLSIAMPAMMGHGKTEDQA